MSIFSPGRFAPCPKKIQKKNTLNQESYWSRRARCHPRQKIPVNRYGPSAAPRHVLTALPWHLQKLWWWSLDTRPRRTAKSQPVQDVLTDFFGRFGFFCFFGGFFGKAYRRKFEESFEESFNFLARRQKDSVQKTWRSRGFCWRKWKIYVHLCVSSQVVSQLHCALGDWKHGLENPSSGTKFGKDLTPLNFKMDTKNDTKLCVYIQPGPLLNINGVITTANAIING